MANTFDKISKTVLTGNSASVTFNSIPQTYTDLCLKISARTDEATSYSGVLIEFNDNQGPNYSYVRMLGNGTGVAGAAGIENTQAYINFASNAGSNLANSFSNTEIYMPLYTTSTSSLPFGIQNCVPTNASEGYAGSQAHVFLGFGPITKIYIYASGSSNFVANSSFCLYGIKNS